MREFIRFHQIYYNLPKSIHFPYTTLFRSKGFKAAGLHSGVKRKRNDLGIIYSEVPAQAAAVYTLNKIKAEPLKLTKQSLNKRSEEHTSELQSRGHIVCRLLLEKKNKITR